MHVVFNKKPLYKELETEIWLWFLRNFENITIIVVVVVVVIIELTHSKTIVENTVEIEPQPVVLDFKNPSQYSGHSK